MVIDPGGTRWCREVGIVPARPRREAPMVARLSATAGTNRA